MKVTGPTGWRGVMNRSPQRSDFGLSPLADNVESLTQRPRVRVSRIQHGIGGGMQLTDSDAGFMAPSRLRDERTARQLSLTTGRTAVGVYAAVFITGLLIVHIHLRFQILDMKMQQHALQTQHRHLEREASWLESGYARLGNLGRLKDLAVMKHQMKESTEHDAVTISPYLVEKYSATSIAADRQAQLNHIAAATNAHSKNPFRRIANMAVAFARN